MTPRTMTLRAGDLSLPDLMRLLDEAALPDSERARCWLDAPDGWALDYWRGAAGRVRWNGASRAPRDQAVEELLPRVISGRVFAPSGELKWRLLPALGERCCRTVFLGQGWNSHTLNKLPVREELAALHREEAAYPLWGQQTAATPGEWIDLRIPHRMKYPVDAEAPAKGRVIANAAVELWKDEHGDLHFVRLCGLHAQWEE